MWTHPDEPLLWSMFKHIILNMILTCGPVICMYTVRYVHKNPTNTHTIASSPSVTGSGCYGEIQIIFGTMYTHCTQRHDNISISDRIRSTLL